MPVTRTTIEAIGAAVTAKAIDLDLEGVRPRIRIEAIQPVGKPIRIGSQPFDGVGMELNIPDAVNLCDALRSAIDRARKNPTVG
jgi:hypothetical protein